MAHLLDATGITKSFGSRVVLRNASFSVCHNEILGLIGPNGAGKTTLFECVAGLMPIDSGNVRFQGNRKQALFYVPDGIRPWGDQTVRWVLSFFEALHKGKSAPLAAALKLDHLMSARVGSLSK